MATVSHASLTADADLHEPKGAAAAAANTVYIADGAGSGSFQNPITALDLIADSNASINTSFTPVLRLGGTDITTTGGIFSARGGSFTRVASLVLCTMTLTLTAKGFSTGVVELDLPHNNVLSGPSTVFASNAIGVPAIGLLTTSTDRVRFLKADGTQYTDSSLLPNTTLIANCIYGLAS